MYPNSRMKQRVLLTGNDAIDLLHRITTVNTKRLPLNEKTPSLILNPKGKILCFFELTRKDKDAIEVEFEENFLELLDQYTFGEKYEIEKLSSLGLSEPDESTRIRSMNPKLGHEFKADGETNPLEVNLRSAIHDNKGCYPGQEVIEKIISLGSPAKKLCLLEGDTSTITLLPAVLFDSTTGLEVGSITSVAANTALATIKRTHLKENQKFTTKTHSDEALLTLIKIS
jgi:folate-binding protein YgfZ